MNSSTPANGPKRSALIIDDEPSIRRVSARVLANDFATTSVESAEEGLALIASGAFFDVIVCDMCLPGMSGRQLFEHLQTQYPAQAARLVILSGAGPDASDARFMDALEGRWLAKPMRGEDLRSMAHAAAGVCLAA